MAGRGAFKIQALLSGGAQLQRNLNLEARRLTKKMGAALETAGYRIHEIVEPLTPIDTGDLRGSRFVASRLDSAGVGITVGFASAHAAVVHEKTEQNFVIGQAKFLETGFRIAAPNIDKWVAAAMNGRLVVGAGLARLAAADSKAMQIRHPADTGVSRTKKRTPRTPRKRRGRR